MLLLIRDNMTINYKVLIFQPDFSIKLFIFPIQLIYKQYV